MSTDHTNHEHYFKFCHPTMSLSKNFYYFLYYYPILLYFGQHNNLNYFKPF